MFSLIDQRYLCERWNGIIETSFRKKCMQRKQQSDRLGQFQNIRVLKDMNGPISESPLMVCVFGYKSQLCHKKTSHQTALNLPIFAYTLYHPPITHHLQHLITQDMFFWQRHISTTLALMASCCDIHHMCKHILQRPEPSGPLGGIAGPATAAPPVDCSRNFRDHPGVHQLRWLNSLELLNEIISYRFL